MTFYYITYRYVPGGSKQYLTVDTPTKESAKIYLALKVFEGHVLTLGAKEARKIAMSAVCNVESVDFIDG